jgi:hypothetical protein
VIGELERETTGRWVEESTWENRKMKVLTGLETSLANRSRINKEKSVFL